MIRVDIVEKNGCPVVVLEKIGYEMIYLTATEANELASQLESAFIEISKFYSEKGLRYVQPN